MFEDFRKKASEAKKYLIEAYGPKAKTIIVSRPMGITSTRDGKEIIESLNPRNNSAILNELCEVAKFTEDMAGDGTSSSMIAFCNSINHKNKSEINEKELDKTVSICHKTIEEAKCETTKESIYQFVNTSCGKTLSLSSIQSVANIIEESRFKSNRYLYVSDKLMSDPEKAIKNVEMSHSINDGFSFDYNTVYPLRPSILRQLESNWIVSFMKGVLTLDALKTLEVGHASSVLNIDSSISKDHKVLLICRSFSPEISEYFSKLNPAKILIYPIILPKKTMNDAEQLLDAMMMSTGVKHTVDELLVRTALLNKWTNDIDVSKEISALAHRSGTNKSDTKIHSFKDMVDKLVSVSNKDSCSRGSQGSQGSNNSKETIIKDAQMDAMSYFAKSMSEIAGQIVTGVTVKTINIAPDSVSIIGCEMRCSDSVKSMQVKNIERLNKSADPSEKILCLMIDMILSMQGSCSIMVYDHVGVKRVTEIRDSLKDVISSANCIRKHDGHFVPGDFYTVKKIIENLELNRSNTDMLFANILRDLLCDYLSTYNNAGYSFSESKENNTIDSSESIKCIIYAITRGINFITRTSENIIECK